MWRDTWRSAEMTLPRDGELVIIMTEKNAIRSARYQNERFMKVGVGDTLGAEFPDVKGWIPFPDTEMISGSNTQIPLEAVWPYVQRDMARLRERNEKLESAYAELKDGYQKLWQVAMDYKDEYEKAEDNLRPIQQYAINLQNKIDKLEKKNKELAGFARLKGVKNDIENMMNKLRSQVDTIAGYVNSRMTIEEESVTI